MCDNNLAHAVIEREIYIKNILNQHLKDKNETNRRLFLAYRLRTQIS